MITVSESLFAARDNELVTLEIEGFGSFDLFLRQPTAAEQISSVVASTKSQVEQVQARLACVVGWSGVQDAEGKEIPFTRPRLEALIAAYPAVAIEVIVALVRLFAGPSETAKKNSGAMSDASSTGSAADQ